MKGEVVPTLLSSGQFTSMNFVLVRRGHFLGLRGGVAGGWFEREGGREV